MTPLIGTLMQVLRRRDESWVGVEFYKGETDQYTPLEKPIYIHLNFDNVKLDAEASYTKDGKVGYASIGTGN